MPAFSPRIRGHIDEALTFLKWVLYACNIGLIVGAVAVAFHYGIDWAAQFRAHQPWVILFLPLGGVVIVLLYRWSGMERDRGTNLVLTAGREAEPIRLRTPHLPVHHPDPPGRRVGWPGGGRPPAGGLHRGLGGQKDPPG